MLTSLSKIRSSRVVVLRAVADGALLPVPAQPLRPARIEGLSLVVPSEAIASTSSQNILYAL